MAEFGAAFADLARQMQYVGESGFGQWVPVDAAAASAARARVSQLSGPAARVAEEHGAWMAYTPPPIIGGATVHFSPIANWSVVFDTSHPMEVRVENVLDYANQLVGRLDHQHRDARARERTLAGKVARFATFPREVREAAGLPAKSLGGRAVLGFGVALQTMLLGTVGAVLTAAVLKWLGL